MSAINILFQNPDRSIDVLFQSPDRFCEVWSGDIPTGECAVEEMASLALLTIFDTVLIEDVSVTFPPAHARPDSPIAIAIRAQGCDPLPMVDLAHLDCAIEDRLACAMVELFGSLNVERCTVC